MKRLLAAFAFVFGLTACTLTDPSDPDIVYDAWGRASLSQAARTRIETSVTTLLQGYGLKNVKVVEIETTKRAIFSAEGGSCSLEFYHDPNGSVSLIIEKRGDYLKAVSFANLSELKQKALLVDCKLG